MSCKCASYEAVRCSSCGEFVIVDRHIVERQAVIEAARVHVRQRDEASLLDLDLAVEALDAAERGGDE